MRFLDSADHHHVPRHSTWYIIMTTRPRPVITNWGEAGLWYQGLDDRGVEIEVITVQRGRNETVVHSMPINLRHRNERG